MDSSHVYVLQCVSGGSSSGHRICGVFSSEARARAALERARADAGLDGYGFELVAMPLDELMPGAALPPLPRDVAPPPWASASLADGAPPPWRVESSLPPSGPGDDARPSRGQTTEPPPSPSARLHELIARDPTRAEPYRLLFQLHRANQAHEHARAVAAVLTFLGHADDEVRQCLGSHRARRPLEVGTRLSGDTWVEHLIHPDEDLLVSKVMEMIAPAALTAKVAQLRRQNKQSGLDLRFRQDPATSTVTFARVFGKAAQALGIIAPALYVRNDVPGSILAVPTLPPASVAGQTVLSGLTLDELAFLCGKHLAHYWPAHYIVNLFPTIAELTILFLAGVHMADPKTPLPPDMQQQIARTAHEVVKHMQPIQLEGLRLAVKEFLNGGASTDIGQWRNGVEATACRAGFVLCGELEIAKKILASESQLPGHLSVRDKMGELLKFAISDDYLDVCRALGTM